MRDLFATELGFDPVENKSVPRDLLAYEEAPTYEGQLEKYKADDMGFDETEQQIIGQLFSPEELAEIEKQEPIGFLEALKGKGYSNMIPYYGTGQDIAELGFDLSIINKAKEGDASAIVTVKQKLKEDYTKQIRGTSIGGKIGNILHYAPPFMGEMIVAAFTFGGGAAPQAGKVATAAAVQTGKKAVVKNIVSTVGKGALKSTAITAKMPQQVAKNYLDRRVAGSIQLTDKGSVILHDMEEAPATTAVKALGDAWVEVASEMSGGIITKGVGTVVAPVAKVGNKALSPVFNKVSSGIPQKVKDAVFRTVKKVKPDADIARMLSDRVYFNGIVGEIGEERWAGVLKTTLGLDDRDMTTADKYLDAMFPDKDQLLAELGAFSMIGVSSHATAKAYNGLLAKGFSKDQAKAMLSTMSENEKTRLASEIGLPEAASTVEFPIENIKLSADIPNFKEGSNENGVVAGEQLQGKYERTGTAPIVLWERNNGDVEIITGRHRLDLAKRTGEKTIPAQIVKESDGWTVERARMFDIEQNIRDEKGSVRDYARFFRTNETTEEEANADGLLGRTKGRTAFDIAKKGTEGLYGLFINGKIGEEKAAAIAAGAPNNDAAQNAGIKAAKKMTPDELRAYVSLLAQTKPTIQATEDMFGFDDSATKEAEAIARLVAGDKKLINDKIRAVKGALHNPKAAEEMGLKFEFTPENIGKEVEKLQFQIAQLENFFKYPALMGYYRDVLHGKGGKIPSVFAMNTSGVLPKKMTLEDALLPFTPENIEKVALASKVPIGLELFLKAQDHYVNPFYSYEPSVASRFKSALTDYLEPLRALGYSVYRDARLFAGVGGKIVVTITDHTENLDGKRTGEGLLPIVKDFQKEFGVNLRTFEKDFGDYLIAKRYNDLVGREDIVVTDQQVQESLDNMERLLNKYGDQLKRFEHYAERIYDYQKRVSHLLLESGLISKKGYENMLKNNPHYVPFKRILDENRITKPEPEVKNAKGRGLLKAFPTIRRIKGSELDIRNPFASIVNNTASIIVNANKNRIIRKVASLQAQYPQLIKNKEIPTASYDKGLREMLVEGAKQLGIKYERVNHRLSISGAIGVYQDSESRIRERIGVDAALAHEFGHALDHRAGLGKAILINDEVRDELKTLANERLGADLVIKNGRFSREQRLPKDIEYAEYLYSDPELIANLYDAYINAPELLKECAPTAQRLLEKYIENSPHQWLRDIHRTLEVGLEEIRGELDRAKNIVSYYINGRKKYIEVHEDMFDALSGVDTRLIQPTVDMIINLPVKLLRWGATQANITFALIRNPLRDTLTAAMQTKVGFKPIYSTLKGAGHKLLNTETYKEWKASGGSFDSFMQINENSKINPYQELFGNLNKFKPLNPFWWIEKAGQLFEEGTRVGVYELARERGMDKKEAAFVSRDSTIDFARGGKYTKKGSQIIPFLNANVQGLVSMTEKFKKNPIGMTVKAIAELTIPSVLLSYWYTTLADDEDKRYYAELPVWQKNLFWNMKVGETWVTIPKPFAYGAVFATFPQAITEGITTDTDIEWLEQVANIADNFNVVGDISSMLPLPVKIYSELSFNKNFYTGDNIVPTYLLNVNPEDQYMDKTSEAAKTLGELTGMSPMKMEHFITSAGAGVMRDFLTTFDMLSKNNAPAKDIGEIPVARGIIAKEPIGYGSRSVQKFMDKFEDLSKTYNSFKKREREDPERADAYAEEHEREIDLYEELKGYDKEIRAISKEINAIAQADDMSPREKQREIRELKKEMTSTAKEALDVFEEN